jgi:hypothetical protein
MENREISFTRTYGAAGHLLGDAACRCAADLAWISSADLAHGVLPARIIAFSVMLITTLSAIVFGTASVTVRITLFARLFISFSPILEDFDHGLPDPHTRIPH